MICDEPWETTKYVSVKSDKTFFLHIGVCHLCFSVGASPVFQQQDHLWPGGGEVQRHHLHPGEESWGHFLLHSTMFLSKEFINLFFQWMFGKNKPSKTSYKPCNTTGHQKGFRAPGSAISLVVSHVKVLCWLTDWRWIWCAAGWGVSETGRRQWHHLPGEAGDHRRRTRALCHVSLHPAKRHSVTLKSICGSESTFLQ